MSQALRKICVAILDDHQSIIDGYLYRLSSFEQIEVVGTIVWGELLEPLLANFPQLDVLILDVSVPIASDNPSPYPVLHVIPSLLQKYPRLNILVVTMFAERGLIRAIAEAGVSGYILKDDRDVLQDLGNVILSIADGGICFSERAHQILMARDAEPTRERLSGRQLEALSLSAAYPDETTAELAEKMAVSNSTLRNLLSAAYMRLGVRTRAAAIDKARALGLITPRTPPFPAGSKPR